VYAWQKRGERIIVPATRGKSQNVLGFMWHRCQKFFSFVFEGAVNSQVVTGCFDIFAQSIDKETVIVIDNAPAHRSQEFDEKIEDWEKLGLKVYFLPAYCPMLNKIEMLWEKIKYDWLNWEAYTSQRNLCKGLDEILSQIGSKYLITFS
jgi:transposase